VQEGEWSKGGALSVEVRLPTVLRSHAGGQAKVTAKGTTIGEVLADLVSSYPAMAGQVLTEHGALHRFVNVYVNDDDVRYLEQLDTKVSDGDTVSILPAVAGG
jgi:molybdopterin synthase sulfur carrier subunit